MNDVELYRLALKERYEEAYGETVSFQDFLVAKLFLSDVPTVMDNDKEKELNNICIEFLRRNT